jgi:hypothetical protein
MRVEQQQGYSMTMLLWMWGDEDVPLDPGARVIDATPGIIHVAVDVVTFGFTQVLTNFDKNNVVYERREFIKSVIYKMDYVRTYLYVRIFFVNVVVVVMSSSSSLSSSLSSCVRSRSRRRRT